MKIVTRDSEGRTNGYLIPVWNILTDLCSAPDQVYVTAIAPHSMKGPHLHHVRRGLFCCIFGNVKIVTRMGDSYVEHWTGEGYNHALILVPAGMPAAIYNDGDIEALVLNLPRPAWSADNPDEWPVADWTYGQEAVHETIR